MAGFKLPEIRWPVEVEARCACGTDLILSNREDRMCPTCGHRWALRISVDVTDQLFQPTHPSPPDSAIIGSRVNFGSLEGRIIDANDTETVVKFDDEANDIPAPEAPS